jgi:hypothetical protein
MFDGMRPLTLRPGSGAPSRGQDRRAAPDQQAVRLSDEERWWAWNVDDLRAGEFFRTGTYWRRPCA